MTFFSLCCRNCKKIKKIKINVCTSICLLYGAARSWAPSICRWCWDSLSPTNAEHLNQSTLLGIKRLCCWHQRHVELDSSLRSSFKRFVCRICANNLSAASFPPSSLSPLVFINITPARRRSHTLVNRGFIWDDDVNLSHSFNSRHLQKKINCPSAAWWHDFSSSDEKIHVFPPNMAFYPKILANVIEICYIWVSMAF